MKKLALALAFCFSLGCINVAYADFLGIGRAWENIKRETTNVLQPVEKAVSKGWEDTKREATNFANSKEGAGVICIVVTGAAFATGDIGTAIKGLQVLADIF